MDDCVNNLDQRYNGKCRVIRDQGDYNYIIRVRFGETTDSIQVQISIPKNMDDQCFDIHVRGGEDKIRSDLESYLQQNQKLQESVSLSVMELFKSAETWLSTNSPQDSCTSESPTKKSAKSKATKTSVAKSSEEERKQKNPSMKTAEDVIKRLHWDSSLPADQFTVGYLDRFIGVIEKPFLAFNWEDLVNAEPTDLAIPQHRIQYFCYKATKVWDKNEKLDLVFNSLGAGVTIYDVIRMQDEQTGCAASSEGGEPSVAFEGPVEGERSSDGDEPTLRGPSTDAEDVPKGVRPDYFLAIPIDDPVLKSRVSMVQGSFKSQFPNVIKTMLDLDHLHVTVALFCSRDTPSGVGSQDIVTALRSEQDSLKIITDQIQFRGLNLLADRVLCSCPQDNFKETILEKLKMVFDKYHIKVYMPSIPHLTIGKLNLSNDLENSVAIKNLINASRFNGVQTLNRFVLRPVGVKTSEEITFSIN